MRTHFVLITCGHTEAEKSNSDSGNGPHLYTKIYKLCTMSCEAFQNQFCVHGTNI